jgi:SAM-dependent methyltransferase
VAFNAAPGATSFGETAALYDMGRPAYPPELFAWLKERCSLGPHSDCFEIGAGAGHATLPVLALPVGSILAIEPDRALAGRLRSKAPDDPRLSLVHATFEQADLIPAAFDFGFAATSFHWLKRMKALARIVTALKPGAHFAMWWSIYQNPLAPDAFDLAAGALLADLEQKPGRRPEPPFALDTNARLGEMRAAGFVDLRHLCFEKSVDFTAEGLAALYATLSRVRMARPEVRDQLLAGVMRIAREEFGGSVVRTIPTSVFLGRRPT